MTTTAPKKKSVTLSRKPVATDTLADTSINSPVAATVSDEENAKNLFGKAVYSSIYFASYGIVFGAMLVSSFIPATGRNLLGKAINDGSSAARNAFKKAGEELQASKTAKSETTASA